MMSFAAKLVLLVLVGEASCETISAAQRVACNDEEIVDSLNRERSITPDVAPVKYSASAADARCRVAPDREVRECSLTAIKKSFTLGPETRVFFRNPRHRDVNLFWVDFSGAEVLIDTIPGFGRLSRDTYMGHVFRIRSLPGQVLLELTVGLLPIKNEAKIENAPRGPVPDNREHERIRHRMDPAGFWVGFVNHAGFYVDLHFVDQHGHRKELVAQIGSEQYTYEFTYYGHSFHAALEDGRFVAAIRMDDIDVPSCPEVASGASAMLQSNLLSGVDVIDRPEVVRSDHRLASPFSLHRCEKFLNHSVCV